ncbi:MAG: Flagellar motor stator protein MotA [Ignavibacteria bacterium]|nr:Flagellar motor stator protein MotA [Ignavibacteria bacterium]
MVIVGFLVVVGSAALGFMIAVKFDFGRMGAFAALPEYLIIIGAATGALLISAPMPLIKRIIAGALGILKGPKVSKKAYIELLKLLYELFQFAKREGLIALEPHVEKPDSSTIMAKYSTFLANHHGVEFLCDTLKIVLSGGVPAHDLEELMDLDLESVHSEELMPSAQLTVTADSFPGLGIVAAVLGVIVTMGAINEGAAKVGEHIAGALVGTFIGVLFSYGFVGPVAKHMDSIVKKESTYLAAIKASLLSFAKGAPASVAVEYGRRAIEPEYRPSFKETEEALKSTK